MTRLPILFVAFLLAVHGQQALAQDKAKPKAAEQPLPSDVADWNIKQLLEHYDPAESDNKVGRELEKRGKDKRFIVFNKDRAVDVKSSEFLFKELRKGFAERKWYEVGGTLAKTYKVGVQPEELLDENPLYPGEALRLDGTCDHTKRKWTGVPLITRQVLYLAITDSKELKIEKVGDAHDILDRLKGKNAADSEAWLKERYPAAYRSYGEKKDRTQLPILKISSDKVKSGQAEGTGRSFPKVAGTTWVNSRNVTFTWERDGSLSVGGKPVVCIPVARRRVAIMYSQTHIEELVFNDEYTTFKQWYDFPGKVIATGRRTSADVGGELRQGTNDTLVRRLTGTKWRISTGVVLEFTENLGFHHKENPEGKLRYVPLGPKRILLPYGPGNVHLIVFNDAFTTFVQYFGAQKTNNALFTGQRIN